MACHIFFTIYGPRVFLGRQISHKMATRLEEFPPDLRQWTNTHIGKYLIPNGDDLPGNFILGEQSIDSEFTGVGHNWVRVMGALKEQWLVRDQDVHVAGQLLFFGQLIYNTDMHLGNLAIFLNFSSCCWYFCSHTCEIFGVENGTSKNEIQRIKLHIGIESDQQFDFFCFRSNCADWIRSVPCG